MPVRAAASIPSAFKRLIISPTDFEQDQRRPSQSRLLAYAGRRDEPHLSLTHTLYRRLSPAGRTRELECGLFSRGGLGKEDTLADAIPPFLLFFVVFLIVSCLPPHCKILCTIVSPFLTQLGLLVMGGCITGWVSSVCASSLRGTHFSVPTVFLLQSDNSTSRGQQLWEERELTAIPSKNSDLEIIHHDVSKAIHTCRLSVVLSRWHISRVLKSLGHSLD